MRKWILILFPLFFGHQTMVAQDMVGCTQLLEDAREAYTAGMVELVPELLLPCLESGGFHGTLRQEAYKLVITAYLFDYLPEEANIMMDAFVDEFIEYRAQANDPAEFTLLLDSHLRARGIDPAEVAVVEENVIGEGEANQGTERVAVYKTPFEYESSIGFLLGLSGTFPLMVEKYSVGDPATDEVTFGVAPGFQVGASMNLLLGRSMEIAFDLLFNRTSFNYTATPLSFTTYVYEEAQNHLQLPVSVMFRLNPNSPRISVYLRAGIVADYLLSASGSGTRSYEESLKDITVENTDITDSRTRLNLHGMAGFGIRIPLEKAYIFMETRFTSGLFMANREENRYLNGDLTWLLYHVDSDFRINQLSFSAGMAWNL